MRHPSDRREKLQMAGLSMASELRDNEIANIDEITIPEAQNMTSAGLRAAIKGEGMTKKKRTHPTILEEATRLLREAGKAMHYRDLADKILEAGNAKPKGKTFTQTLSAALAREAGREDADVERVAPGVYKTKGEG